MAWVKVRKGKKLQSGFPACNREEMGEEESLDGGV